MTLQIWESFPVSSLNSPTLISYHMYRRHSTYEKLELISTNSNASVTSVHLVQNSTQLSLAADKRRSERCIHNLIQQAKPELSYQVHVINLKQMQRLL